MAETILEAVGALIICQDVPDLFLGVRHTQAKEASLKLASQISMPTETKHPGETDVDAIQRLWEEELAVQDIKDPGIYLNACVFEAPRAKAILRTHLFFAPYISEIRLIDGEIADTGWSPFHDCLNTPRGSWRFRSGLYESIQSYRNWVRNPEGYYPVTYTQSIHSIPMEVFVLMRQGFTEKEALSRLGLDLLPQPGFLVPFH